VVECWFVQGFFLSLFVRGAREDADIVPLEVGLFLLIKLLDCVLCREFALVAVLWTQIASAARERHVQARSGQNRAIVRIYHRQR
jgi:hypothetical protein